jgi:hypothetical protein
MVSKAERGWVNDLPIICMAFARMPRERGHRGLILIVKEGQVRLLMFAAGFFFFFLPETIRITSESTSEK